MKDNKIPSPLVSLLPVFVLILLLFVTIRTFGSDALSGGSQVCLLVATAVCVLIGMAGFRRPWKDFELAVTNNIAGVSTALIILLIIGALSGAWMVSGVVPTLIYYGIQVIHPHFFLAKSIAPSLPFSWLSTRLISMFCSLSALLKSSISASVSVSNLFIATITFNPNTFFKLSKCLFKFFIPFCNASRFSVFISSFACPP